MGDLGAELENLHLHGSVFSQKTATHYGSGG